MRQNDFRSVIIVSSGYHLRRAKLAFERLSKGKDFQFYYHAADQDSDDHGLWWMDVKYLLVILGEYKKLIGAYFIYNHTGLSE